MKKLVCKKCKKENILDAKYCLHCGNKFTDEEISKAKRFTFVGILEMLDKFNSIKNLSIITENKVFRVLSIIVVLMIGAVNLFLNGNSMKLAKSDNYIIKHYKDMYYILLDKEKTIVDLYIPNDIKYIEVELMDNDEEKNKTKYELTDKLELSSNDKDTYYLISGIKDNLKETIKAKLVYEGEKS